MGLDGSVVMRRGEFKADDLLPSGFVECELSSRMLPEMTTAPFTGHAMEHAAVRQKKTSGLVRLQAEAASDRRLPIGEREEAWRVSVCRAIQAPSNLPICAPGLR